ncbi:MAG: septal ring lytic transglycosylase RlpA family protein [Candidatus Binatia bacterium]
MVQSRPRNPHRASSIFVLAPLLAFGLLSACALSPGKISLPTAPPTATTPVQTGIASWYGPGFHGRATASGAIYNQHELTAAHQTLPLGTRVIVTNLENGRSTEVVINDRGPFLKGRIIDLSYAAAQALGMIAPGTIPVRIEVIGPKVRSIRPSLDYTLQAGSFADVENAHKLVGQLTGNYSDLKQISIVPFQSRESIYYRVQLGTFSTRSQAEEEARLLARRGFPVIVMEK